MESLISWRLHFHCYVCCTAPAGNSTVGSADKKNVIVAGDRIEVIISSTKEDANVSLRQILQRLESVNAENKKLVKDVQALKGQVQTLEDKGDFLLSLFRQQCYGSGM